MKTNIILLVAVLVLAVALGYAVMLFGDNRCIDPSKNPGWCGDLSGDVVYCEDMVAGDWGYEFCR